MQANEKQTTKEILRRTITLMSCAESLSSWTISQLKISAPSPELRLLAEVTLELASLTMAAAFVSQSDAERLFWTSDTTRLASFLQHLRTAHENLESWNSSVAVAPLELFEP